ncbi:MAG TPA: hypothetical protein VFV50_01990 [Bdellovibrionales bacterium]|nr:hypothetical protein [Bdellovibrionales bacterium]
MANQKRAGGSSAGSHRKSKRNPKGPKTQDALLRAFEDDDAMRAPSPARPEPVPDVDLSDLDTGGPFVLGGRPKMRGRIDKKPKARRTEEVRGGKRRGDAKRDTFEASRAWQSRRNSPKQSGRNIEGAFRRQPNRH